MSARLLTVAEAAQTLRGDDTPTTRDFVRGLIIDGRLAAIKQRGRWYIQARSIEDLSTPRRATPPAANPPRVVLRKGRRVA